MNANEIMIKQEMPNPLKYFKKIIELQGELKQKNGTNQIISIFGRRSFLTLIVKIIQ